MDEKRTVFSYIGQAFATYGAMVVIFIIFSLILDEGTGEYSTLFELGNKGLTLHTLLQLLFLACIVTAAQILFLTDVLLKNLPIVARNALFFATILASVVVFACIFGWFPIDDPKAWLGFGVSFGLSMAASIIISRAVEKAENRSLQAALEKYNNSRNDT
ncbi:MAG: hypothetical protein ILP17_00190 [Lachnospiraceae bacterium]|nr:hypothetical protein [Lachnospiraceae bacterium]